MVRARRRGVGGEDEAVGGRWSALVEWHEWQTPDGRALGGIIPGQGREEGWRAVRYLAGGGTGAEPTRQNSQRKPKSTPKPKMTKPSPKTQAVRRCLSLSLY